MGKRIKLTRRFPAAMTEDGYRRLRKLAVEADMSEGDFLSFLFENFDSVMDAENLPHRLALWQQALASQRT